ncbi:MAG: hypothetical protein QW767_05345 [Thermoprotei archaeon]
MNSRVSAAKSRVAGWKASISKRHTRFLKNLTVVAMTALGSNRRTAFPLFVASIVFYSANYALVQALALFFLALLALRFLVYKAGSKIVGRG